jgi:hypothetical protein
VAEIGQGGWYAGPIELRLGLHAREFVIPARKLALYIARAAGELVIGQAERDAAALRRALSEVARG